MRSLFGVDELLMAEEKNPKFGLTIMFRVVPALRSRL